MSDEEKPTGIELDASHDYDRLKRAYNIACFNLTELNNENRLLKEGCEELIATLVKALDLLTHLTNEMRVAGVVPSGPVVFAKANLDQAMVRLVAKAKTSKRN